MPDRINPFSTRGQRPELDVTIDRALAGSLGIRVADVAQALRPAFAGVDAGDWTDPAGRTRAPPEYVSRTSSVERAYQPQGDGCLGR
jgi:multidrug efflux pump subunit AcrB